jgi:esterase/lipase
MTQDNAYAFASFIVQGGHGFEGENFNSIRIFGSVDDALDYARDLLDHGYDYVYVTGVNADGSLDLKEVTRVADDEPSVVDLG